MDDTLNCPICGARMRTVYRENRQLYMVGKVSNWAERTCNGMNHTLQIFTDQETNQVGLLSMSLNPKYSRFLEVDFINQKCRINCMKDSVQTFIDIPKMVELDFPLLTKLKERIALYVVFS